MHGFGRNIEMRMKRIAVLIRGILTTLLEVLSTYIIRYPSLPSATDGNLHPFFLYLIFRVEELTNAKQTLNPNIARFLKIYAWMCSPRGIVPSLLSKSWKLVWYEVI